MIARVASATVLAIVAAVGAGCGASDSGSSSATTSTASASVAFVTTSPAAPVEPVTTAATATIAVPAEGMIAELEVLGGPDWLAADDHGVWVKLDNGAVVLIDPATNSVVETFEVGGDPCQGLGAGDGAIWACSGSDVARISPGTRGVASVLRTGKTFAQGELAVLDGQLWVLTGDGSTLQGFDTETQHLWSRFALPVRGTDLDVGEAGLWVVSSVDGAVVNVDLDSGKVLHRVAVSSPVDVAVDREVWVGASTETVRIDVESGAVDLTVAAGVGADGGIALTTGEVWVRDAQSFLTRVDRNTGAIVASYPSDVTSGGDVVYAFGSIWTSAFDDARVFRFAAPA